MRTSNQLKKIALEIFKGNIFCSRDLFDPDHIKECFSLDRLTNKEVLALFNKRPSIFFEYTHRQFGVAEDQRPIFRSFQYLTREEWIVIKEHLQQLKQQKEIQ